MIVFSSAYAGWQLCRKNLISDYEYEHENEYEN